MALSSAPASAPSSAPCSLPVPRFERRARLLRAGYAALTRVALILCTLSFGCSDCNDHGRGRDDAGIDRDGDVDETDGGSGPIPGERPTLSSPGQIVPLLWGRVVELHDDVNNTTERFALDDPSQALYQRFFAALDAACTADFADVVSAPSGISITPGCDAEGVYQTRLHQCRAQAGAAFIAANGAGLVSVGGAPQLNLSEHSNAGDALWSARSTDSNVRASFGLFVVAELREAVASASLALDPTSCEVLTEEHALLLASDLRQASEELALRTQLASGLLRQSLSDVHKADPDESATRIRVTRALNHSLLEEQKLYAGIPYAAFTPHDGEGDAPAENAPAARYPVLLTAPNAAAERAATLLSLTGSVFADEDAQVANEDTLGASFMMALRAHEPLLLGHLPGLDLPGALARLDLVTSDLTAGAQLLGTHLHVSGAPSFRLSSLDVAQGVNVAQSAQLAPTAYVNAITGARATRQDDALPSYARRGLHHALDAARLAATRAQERADLPREARANLTVLSAGSSDLLGTLQACEDSEGATLTLLRAQSAESSDFEWWAGETGVACARSEECDDQPYRVTGDAAAGIKLAAALPTTVATTRYYLTARSQGNDSKDARSIVASVSTRPLDNADEERCFFEPLTVEMHSKMRGLHDRQPLPIVPRSAGPWRVGSALKAAASDPVGLSFGRSVSASDAAGQGTRLDLGEPFSTVYLALEQGLATVCPAPTFFPNSTALRECGEHGLARASVHDCHASWARRASRGTATSITLDGLTLQLTSEADRLSLALFARQASQRAQLEAADVLDPARCGMATPDLETASAARDLLSRLIAESRAELKAVTDALEAEASALRASESDPSLRRLLRTRGLSASSLASARLYVNAPRSSYEPDSAESQTEDLFDHALTRFPVVTRRAVLAEDARAERLLRESELQPWLSDLTVQDGLFDQNALASVFSGSALATALRTRLVDTSPQIYGALPADANGFLNALGISSSQLRDATVRIAQTAEIRGLSLLPLAGTTPQRAVGTAALFPAPNGVALAALSGGKLQAAADALPHHFALRGHYHVLMRVAEALARTPASVQDAALAALRADLEAQVEDRIVIEQRAPLTSAGAISVERTVAVSITDAQAKAQTLLVFSDSGLACVLSGQVAGKACSAADYLLDASDVTLSVLAGAVGTTRRLRLEGFRLPATGVWDLRHARELSQGRIYLVEQTATDTRALAGVTLAPVASLPVRHELPRSDALDLSLLELLAFKAPGEGCAACRPRSVCETTRCELDLCVRESAPNGKGCGAEAICEQGACSAPGCGDGARSDGTNATDEGPYEACDDGNLQPNDGCSASCLPELRNLEPVIEEGWPAGPATAIGTDGLGRQLLVYTADALVGDNQLIRAAVLDSFGVQSGTERTLDANVPRVFIAEPCVAGLRDGGFAVVYGSPDIAGEGGIGVRIVTSEGSAGALLRVDDGNATAGSARVASVEDGFVVVWSERAGSALLSRVRARRFDAQGAAIGSSFEVARAGNAIDQVEPTVASSLGQIMIAWSERAADQGTALGIRARRFSPFGSAVDGDAFDVTAGKASEPSLTVLNDDDYLLAWTTRDVDANGDIARRSVQRFGLPLAASEAEPWLSGASAQTRPVVAGLGSAAVVAYQLGSPLPITALAEDDAADPAAAGALAAALAGARERDVSAVATPLGVWFVWSERQAQGRALFAYLLPSRPTP